MRTTRTVSVVSIFIGAIIAIVFGLIFLPQPDGALLWVTRLHPFLIGLSPTFTPPKDQWAIQWDPEKYDLRGQVALVTGSNSGIGFEIAKILSRRGANVTLACRNPNLCFRAASEIQKDDLYSGASVSPLIMDVSSLESVQSAANNFLKYHDTLDMLFLNAGVGFVGVNNDGSLIQTKDGIEAVFATNVVGHHLLYRLLEPALFKSPMARVVFTSSASSFHSYSYGVATDLESLNSARPNLGKVYGQSKLAQILLAKAMTKRLESIQKENNSPPNVYVNAAHPGAVRTPIQSKALDATRIPQSIRNLITNLFLQNFVMWTAQEGAITPLYLGVAKEDIKAKDIRGKYFHPQGEEVVNPKSLDEGLQTKVWYFCEELIKDYIANE